MHFTWRVRGLSTYIILFPRIGRTKTARIPENKLLTTSLYLLLLPDAWNLDYVP